jgi:hypothetical protein
MGAPLPAQLPSGPIDTIEDAIARMTSIDQALPPTDGLACFTRMYQIVTQKVLAEVSGSSEFGDPAFMTHLDVVFVNLFLSAVDGYRAVPSTAPRCWSDLFDARADPHIAPMQFALAGMSGTNAADYEKVNALLGSLDQSIRESFETGIILDLDRQAAGLENVVGNFGIVAAREAAWISALALWRLKGEHWLSKEYADGLDETAALAGRSMMIPLL